MIHCQWDLSELDSLKNFDKTLQDAAKQASRDLASMAHSKAVELAREKLHTRCDFYIENLSVTEEQDVIFLTLDGKARWIEDGIKSGFDMLPGMLNSPKAKHGKDGSIYLAVPFEHGTGPSQTTPANQDLVNTVKKEMKARGIPFKKLERDSQGRPKIGRLHSFDITNNPIKTGQGPGQGWGPQGSVKQGPNERQRVGGGPGGGGIPFLKGISVSQHQMPGGGVKKSITTFRMATSKHPEAFKHPGLDPVPILDMVAEWAQTELENSIIPSIVNALNF